MSEDTESYAGTVTETVIAYVDEQGQPIQEDQSGNASPLHLQEKLQGGPPHLYTGAPDPLTALEQRITSRGPEEEVHDPELYSLEQKHGKLTVVRFQDEKGSVISTEVQDARGSVLLVRGTAGGGALTEEKDVADDPFMQSLESVHGGPLTLSRFVNVSKFPR